MLASDLSAVRTASPPLEILRYCRARLRYLVVEPTPTTKPLGLTGIATREEVVDDAEDVVLALVDVLKVVIVLVVLSTEVVERLD